MRPASSDDEDKGRERAESEVWVEMAVKSLYGGAFI